MTRRQKIKDSRNPDITCYHCRWKGNIAQDCSEDLQSMHMQGDIEDGDEKMELIFCQISIDFDEGEGHT